MYLFDFFKNLFKKSNIGIIVYLILNTLLIVALFSGGFQELGGVFFGLGIYLISLCIALSPIGEWILRVQSGCKKMTRQDDIDRLMPLFNEVYARAKQANPELHSKIKMFISNSDVPNAFATGRRTVCVTRGLLSYTDEQIKGVLAHEFGHLAHKDTDAILVVGVGNTIVTIIFILMRVFASFFFGVAKTFTLFFGDSAGGVLGYLFLSLGKIMSDIVLAVLMWLWTKIGVLLCMYTSRKNEFEADEYAYDRGYGRELKQVLQSFGEGSGSTGLFSALASSHPETSKRINRLNQLESKH